MSDLLTPAQIIQRLESIERDLELRQPELESAAEAWTRAKRDKEHQWALAYTKAHGEKNVTDRKAAAILASELIGVDDEARYTALSKVVEVLNTRAMIGMGLLKAHGRAM